MFIIESVSADHLELRDNHQAHAEVVVAVAGGVVVAIRHSAVPRIVVPATTTVHAVRAALFKKFRLHFTFSIIVFLNTRHCAFITNAITGERCLL